MIFLLWSSFPLSDFGAHIHELDTHWVSNIRLSFSDLRASEVIIIFQDAADCIKVVYTFAKKENLKIEKHRGDL